MSNTTIQLRKSGQTGNTPADLAHGELAINYADGKLFYKNGVGIKSIENQKTFSTVNANNSLIIATSPTDILSLNPGANIAISSNTTTKTITIALAPIGADQQILFNDNGNIVGNPSLTYSKSAEKLSTKIFASTQSAGDEGGQIELSAAQTNSTLNGPINIDIYQNRLRFFEGGGTNRGAYIDLSAATAGVGSNLLAGGGGTTDTVARELAQGAFTAANTAASNTVALQAVNTLQNTNITAVNTFAQSAYNQANTVPTQLQTAGIRTNASYFPLFVDANNATLAAESVYSTGAGITINPSSNTIAATILSGTLVSVQGGTFSQYVDLTVDNAYIEWGAGNDARMMYNGTANTINLQLYSDVISFKVVDNANTADRFIFYKANGDLRLVSGNLIFSDGTIQRTEALTAAQAAYTSANAGVTLSTAAFGAANTAAGNTVALQAQMTTTNTNVTSVNTFAGSAFNSANSGVSLATAAYGKANAEGEINTTQNNWITNTNTFAQAAYNFANTRFSSSGGTISGNVTIQNDLSVLGNVNFIGNVTSITVTGNSGQFFGYASNGHNALYAGIPVGYDFQPFTVFQASANHDGYSQINIQNINAGANASSDLVATADNGTEDDTYIAAGIGSSQHADPDYTLVGPNDGYLYVSGNTVTGGGDLVIGTFLPQNDVIIAAGGMNSQNEQMRFVGSSNTIIIRSNVDSSLAKSVLLGPVANVRITGGSSGQILRTDGAGNLSFINSPIDLATAAYAQANNASGNTVALQAVNTLQNTNITAINTFAQAAYNGANGAVQTGFTTISANSVSITPSSNADTLTITPGTNITISACNTTKTITINSTASGGGGGSGALTYDTAPPASGNTVGDRWVDSNDGTLYTYINDGTSSQWVDFSTSATSASVGGGAANAILYQAAVGNTTFTSVGSQGQLLTAGVGGAPIWAAQTALSIANTQITGLITNAQLAGPLGVTVTDETANSSTFYPLFSDVISGTLAIADVSSTKLTYVPSTGTLSSTVVTSTSDEKLKTNISTIQNPIDTIKQLRGVEYNWKDNGRKSMGVIAQEVEKILPYLVSENENSKSVMYSNMVGLLIEAIKEQQKQIDELRGKLNAD